MHSEWEREKKDADLFEGCNCESCNLWWHFNVHFLVQKPSKWSSQNSTMSGEWEEDIKNVFLQSIINHKSECEWNKFVSYDNRSRHFIFKNYPSPQRRA